MWVVYMVMLTQDFTRFRGYVVGYDFLFFIFYFLMFIYYKKRCFQKLSRCFFFYDQLYNQYFSYNIIAFVYKKLVVELW
ncbi:hypothetical protein L2E82_22566 [Cichorium intybus]|uniref:Uncharacterized protein n=1 Tax=Cichorium intybus TaxID=13427 RepID=A0ACB9DXL0_CICIN|nr:hypothetical protein L2E82_22566 [Cichorium intybus]